MQEAKEYFNALGIEIEDFGENTVNIHSIPSVLNNVDLKELVAEFADDFEDSLTGAVKPSGASQITPVDSMMRMMACKEAIHAGETITPE